MDSLDVGDNYAKIVLHTFSVVSLFQKYGIEELKKSNYKNYDSYYTLCGLGKKFIKRIYN